MIPAIEPLKLVVDRLAGAGIQVALGGSGLLYSLGLVDAVRDWDLTTDAAVPAVIEALGDLPWGRSPTGDQAYATAGRINVTPDGADIDLMVQFAVRCETGVVGFPTIVTGQFESIPVGSPEVWAVAYQLMGRLAKADMLYEYLRQRGARSEIRTRLLAEPLPEAVRSQVLSWKPA